jgi:hypothetical protein
LQTVSARFHGQTRTEPFTVPEKSGFLLFCQIFKKHNLNVSSDRFAGNRLKFQVQLLKIFFFPDGNARIFGTDLKNQCFKNWTKPRTKLKEIFSKQ